MGGGCRSPWEPRSSASTVQAGAMGWGRLGSADLESGRRWAPGHTPRAPPGNVSSPGTAPGPTGYPPLLADRWACPLCASPLTERFRAQHAPGVQPLQPLVLQGLPYLSPLSSAPALWARVRQQGAQLSAAFLAALVRSTPPQETPSRPPPTLSIGRGMPTPAGMLWHTIGLVFCQSILGLFCLFGDLHPP